MWLCSSEVLHTQISGQPDWTCEVQFGVPCSRSSLRSSRVLASRGLTTKIKLASFRGVVQEITAGFGTEYKGGKQNCTTWTQKVRESTVWRQEPQAGFPWEFQMVISNSRDFCVVTEKRRRHYLNQQKAYGVSQSIKIYFDSVSVFIFLVREICWGI